jgi:hypothetical protein
MGALESTTLVLAAVLLVGATAYVHHRLPFHVAGRERLLFTRALLVGVGAAFGYVTVRVYGEVYAAPPALVFVIAFGLVHFPAAVILFLKHERGAGKS